MVGCLGGADMKVWASIAACVLLTGQVATADEPGTALATEASVAAQLHAALERHAVAPSLPPVLPSRASDRARAIHAGVAFGKRGAAKRAVEKAKGAASSVKAGAAHGRSDSSRGAASKGGDAAVNRPGRGLRTSSIRGISPRALLLTVLVLAAPAWVADSPVAQ